MKLHDDMKKHEEQQDEIMTDGEPDEALCPEEAEPENASPGDNLAERLAEAEKQRDEYLDMAQRVQAEFENFRRRTQRASRESFDDGARDFIKTMLPVCDNLERAIAAAGEDSPLKEGVQMVFKQLSEALEKRGVTVIDRVGERFDPMYEDAVVQGDASEGEPGTVCAVLLKGYRMGETVLRHAMVKVVAE